MMAALEVQRFQVTAHARGGTAPAHMPTCFCYFSSFIIIIIVVVLISIVTIIISIVGTISSMIVSFSDLLLVHVIYTLYAICLKEIPPPSRVNPPLSA